MLQLAALPNLNEVDYTKIPCGITELKEIKTRYASERR